MVLYQEFLEREISAGKPPKGLEQEFAKVLLIHPTLWSQIKSGRRAINDKLARQVESHTGHEAGWLDQYRVSTAITPGEQQLLDLCLEAMRGTNSEGRKQLRSYLRELAHKP